MVTDHGRANTELADLVKSKGIAVPTAADPAQKATRDRLSALNGADFDRAYMSQMVSDHTADVALFEREAAEGQDHDIKAWAARTLPTLRDHLALARQVNSEVALAPATVVTVPAALPAAILTPWCQGAYAPSAGTNFGNCAPAK